MEEYETDEAERLVDTHLGVCMLVALVAIVCGAFLPIFQAGYILTVGVLYAGLFGKYIMVEFVDNLREDHLHEDGSFRLRWRDLPGICTMRVRMNPWWLAIVAPSGPLMLGSLLDNGGLLLLGFAMLCAVMGHCWWLNTRRSFVQTSR